MLNVNIIIFLKHYSIIIPEINLHLPNNYSTIFMLHNIVEALSLSLYCHANRRLLFVLPPVGGEILLPILQGGLTAKM